MKWDALNDKSDWLFRKITGYSEESTNDEALSQLAHKLQDTDYIREKLAQHQHFDYLKAYRQLLYPHKRLSRRFVKIAAIMILFMGIGVIIYFQQRHTYSSQHEIPLFAIVKPGERQAFLIMNNGKEIKLGKNTGIISKRNGVNICVDSTGLRYESENIESSIEMALNTLVVPRGGEYSLTLSDGSRVWLNAESELRYPVEFTGNMREVIVLGEAYFEVKKQENRPFVVKTRWGEITVLGTEFNVRDYPEKNELITTLVKGKVSCKLANGQKIILTANQELIVDENGNNNVENVITRYVTSWKDGMFLFEDMRLEEIMEQLARWYDIQVIYTNNIVKNLHFTGDLSRFKSINTFIEMFEKSSDVKITLNGKTLIVGL